MKRLIGFSSIFLLFAFAADSAVAAEGGRNFHINNRIRAEWDDNVNQTKSNEKDSLKIIEEIDLSLNANMPQTFLGLHYKPSFVWWDDRESDDTDFNHAFDGILNHDFSPRFSLGVKDRLRVAEVPEGIADGVIVREKNDFVYNSVNATLSSLLSSETKLDIGGRHIVLAYDEDGVGMQQDYNRYVVGVSLGHEYMPTRTVRTDARYENIAYDDADFRDADTFFLGLGLEETFSPNLLGSIRLGWQHKEFDMAVTDETDSPYVDANFTVLPSPATRLTLGGAFSQSETDVFPFANQERLRFYGTLAHDFTAKIAGYLSATYADGDYDKDEAAVGSDVGDGSEEALSLSLRSTYELNRSNLLELGWQFTDLDSDFGREFTRNRVNVGWTYVF